MKINPLCIPFLLGTIPSATYASRSLRGGRNNIDRELSATTLYDVSDVRTYDLGKAAGHADRKHPVAPIASRPNGGAYIQWASDQDWNGGDKCSANSKVYVTEIDNVGSIVGSDIELGRSQPVGIAATDTDFGYYIKDGDKLTFGVGDPQGNGNGQTVVMDHWDKNKCDKLREEGPPTKFVNGLDVEKWSWDFPFGPGAGSIAYGNGQFGTGFSFSNNYNAEKPDVHSGDAFLFFDGNGAYTSLADAQGDHSSDQRIVFDESSGNFYSVSYAYNLRLRKYDSQGDMLHKGKPLTDPPNGVSYTDEHGNITPDPGHKSKWYGPIKHDHGLGQTGLLGDLHPLGDGTLALTFGSFPWHTHYSEEHQSWEEKNHVEFTLLDTECRMSLRRIVYEADGRIGQGSYTKYLPFERIRWVKSAKVGNGNDASILIFFQTETRNTDNKYKYVPRSVKMVQVDLQGKKLQGPVDVPNTSAFNQADRIAVLSTGSLAWTNTKDGTLKVSVLPPPHLKDTLPEAGPLAQSFGALSFIPEMSELGSHGVSGDIIGWFYEGEYLTYGPFDMSGCNQLSIEYASAQFKDSNLVELRLDGPEGAVVDSFNPPSTGGWYDGDYDILTRQFQATGKHYLTVKAAAGDGGIMNFKNFQLSDACEPTDTSNGPDGPDTTTTGPSPDSTCTFSALNFDHGMSDLGDYGVSGNIIGWIHEDEYITYGPFTMGGSAQVKIEYAAKHDDVGLVELRLDGPDGTLVDSFTTAATGGWYTYDILTRDVDITGTHKLTVKFASGEAIMNLKSFEITNCEKA